MGTLKQRTHFGVLGPLLEGEFLNTAKHGLPSAGNLIDCSVVRSCLLMAGGKQESSSNVQDRSENQCFHLHLNLIHCWSIWIRCGGMLPLPFVREIRARQQKSGDGGDESETAKMAE
jgi:hypothetical protein